MNKLIEQYIIDILIEELGLDGNNIWIANQNRKIPNDLGFYIVVSMIDSQVISNTSTATDNDQGMTETQVVMARQSIQVDLLSKSNEALVRREEVVAALASIYSKQVQEANYFRIFPITRSFVNTSSAEGGSQINRFTLHFSAILQYRKTKQIFEYFNAYRTQVRTDSEGIIIDFTI